MKRTEKGNGAAQIYGVFIGPKFGVVTNRKVAIEAVRKAATAGSGGTVRQMGLVGFRNTGTWDRSTFAVCSTLVYGDPMSFDLVRETGGNEG